MGTEDKKRSTLKLHLNNTPKTKETKRSIEPSVDMEQLMARQRQLKNAKNLEERKKLINTKKIEQKKRVENEIATQKEEQKVDTVAKEIKDVVVEKKNDTIVVNKENNNRENNVRKEFKIDRNFKRSEKELRERRNNNKKDFDKNKNQENKNNKNNDKNKNNSNNKSEDKSKTNKQVDNKLFESTQPVVNKQKEFFKKDRRYDDFNEKEEKEENRTRISKKEFKEKMDERSNKYKNNYFISDDSDDDYSSNNRNNGLKSFRKANKNKKSENTHQKVYHDVQIPELISVAELADRMSEKKADVVKKLFTMGMPVTVNQTIDADTAELIVTEFGHTPIRVSDSDVEKVLENNKECKEFISRSPVVTVMGHVDHGKTSLLDALRSTRIAEGESGGITQHIGASRIETKDGKFITFIDTPGHEAFTEMRIRGANITDIVVLVVAADDGVKDQTIEAINHTKAAGVPMIVAVNKIDKVGADPERVKQELLKYDVVSEDFGGDVMFVNVSAKNRLNMDKLLEAVLLQAEMLDLKAPIDCPAEGAVIEARVDLQKGIIASVLVQKGILKIGDIVVAGTSYGKVKRMIDDKRKNQLKAEPSVAVEILGLNNVPKAGDKFNVVATEKEARDIISYRERKEKEAIALRNGKKTLDNLLQEVGNNKKVLYVIVKADVSGSIEAVNSSLLKLGNNEVSVSIVHSGTGAITETDINLASVSNALIIGFNVRSTPKVTEYAKEKGIEIRYYSIIYNIMDDVKDILSGLLNPVKKEETIGQAEVRNVFKLSTSGTVAGCYVTNGEIQRNLPIRLIRDGVVIYDGKIKALRRFKEDVKEVKNNFECGISIENYTDIKEKDIIECYKIIEEKRGL